MCWGCWSLDAGCCCCCFASFLRQLFVVSLWCSASASVAMVILLQGRCCLCALALTDGDPTSSYPFCLGQDKFIDMMEKIITNKNSVRLTKDEGWYSEGEMKSELGWTSYIS